jgi:hypothetical protein
MKSSRPQSSPQGPNPSLARRGKDFSSNVQAELFSREEKPLPGSMNDDLLVRSVITDAIKLSGKSREQIAEDMSYLLATDVTARMLSAFTAESKEQHRWPGAWNRAFCYATDDYRLMTCTLAAAGVRAVTAQEESLIELGRLYLRRKRDEEKAAALRLDFEGVEL